MSDNKLKRSVQMFETWAYDETSMLPIVISMIIALGFGCLFGYAAGRADGVARAGFCESRHSHDRMARMECLK